MAVEKINQSIAQTQQYFNWVDKPLANECGCEIRHETIRDHVRDCLKPLKTERKNDEWEWLSRNVLVTLFCADQYTPENERFAGNAAERLKNLEKQLKVISKFTNLIKKDPDFGIRFFLHACLSLNSPDKVLFHIPEGQHDLLLKSVFSNYESSLKRVISMDRESQKRMLISSGGLHYCQFNADGTKAVIQDIKLDSTLFHLTYIFRHFTANRLDFWGNSKRMPRFGRPHYDLTAKILDKDTDSVKKHVTRLVKKDVYISHWPISL